MIINSIRENTLISTLLPATLVQWLFAFLCLSVLSLVLTVVYRLFLHPLSSIPGPRFAAATNLYQIFQFLSRGRWQESEYHRLLHEKYGPVIRYGPNTVIVNTPQALPQIYHRKADKTEFYRPLFTSPAAAVTLKHADHVVAKKRLAYGYSMTAMKAFEGEIDSRIQEWIGALNSRFCETGETLRFHQAAGFLAYDVVTEIAFGEPLGFVREWGDVRGLIKSFDESINMIQVLGRLPLLTKIIMKLGIYNPKPTDKHGLGVLMGEVDRIVAKSQHLKEKELARSEKASLLWRFMKTTAEGGLPMTPDQVKFESITAMIAGSRAVSEAISPLVLNILSHPRCYHRLMSEISAADLGSLDSVASFSTASKFLPYFSACVREALRISATPFRMPRVSEGITIAHGAHQGTYVAPGASVAASGRLMLFDKEMYGADADEFRPERWLEAAPETIRLWEKYDIRWGYGTRVCLGKNIAIMEIHKGCLQFFRAFEVELVSFVERDPAAYMDFTVKLRRR